VHAIANLESRQATISKNIARFEEERAAIYFFGVTRNRLAPAKT
jgi:hypothetical protein